MTSPCADRVAGAFALVFPDFTGDPRTASAVSVPGWDSVAMATLVTILEEQLERPVPIDRIGEMDSFDAIVRIVCGS